MKYNYSNEVIPQDQRSDINTKIEYIVNNDLPETETGISKDDIFNAYTGLGGLHGLQFSNYDSYYDYQKAKAEIEQGQFFTPYKLVEWIYDCLHISNTDLVADLTCGHGAFASCCPVEGNFYGCELEGKSYRVAKYLYPDAKLENTDIRFYEPKVTFDYVVGNPPYNLKWRKDDTSYLSEYYYCLKAAELLKPAGIMTIIVPLSFCVDEFSDGGMIAGLNEHFNFICQVELDKNTFKHLGVENYKTKILFVQKKSEYLEDVGYSTDLLSGVSSSEIWEKYLKPVTERRESIKQKTFLEAVRGGKEDIEWQYKIEKLLYDIKRNPLVSDSYAECCEYVNQYRTQKKPEYIKWDEWEQMKIKKSDVEKYLKTALRKQNSARNKENRIIKNNYSFELNGEILDINQAVLYNGVSTRPFDAKWMARLIDKKSQEYNSQDIAFDDMQPDKEIASWLDSFELSDGEETIHLNAAQKKDLNLFLQKRYGFIQWEQGSGKTLAGITIGKYRLEKKQVKNVFVVSTAIAIKNNWNDVLEQYGIDYCMIEKLSDIQNIKPGQFVIITLNMMCKYHKFIKRFVKSICQKAVLIFDESDNISNMYSKGKEAEPKKLEIYQFDCITRESFSAADLAEHDFKLKEIVYVPHGDKQVAFRVEHVTDEKAYLVATDCVGRTKMTDMNEYLDNFMKEMPEDLLDICGEIEHKVNGQLIRKSKVTLLSYGNTTGYENCNGIDDMQFDGLKTEADRCKNDTNGETCWYWEDTPYDYEDWDEDSYASHSTNFLYVGATGNPCNGYGIVSNPTGVCPCLSILRKKKKDNSEE